MHHILEYTIASGSNDYELIKAVRKLIKEGWEPKGGAAIGQRAWQAMIRVSIMEENADG